MPADRLIVPAALVSLSAGNPPVDQQAGKRRVARHPQAGGGLHDRRGDS